MNYQAQENRRSQRTEQKTTPCSEQAQRLKKAKIKALKLLEQMDRTESQLREKLLNAEFEPEIVEQAIAYVKSFGYLDDERYARNYIEYRREQKSRRQLEQELQYKKGVPPELIQRVYEELEPTDEKSLIRKYLEKKRYDPSACDEKQRQRLAASLLRKGFRTGDVLTVMRGWTDPEIP